MDLKEYLVIFKKHYKLFWTIVIFIVLASLAFQFFRPFSYKTSLTLNVTRIGSQQTDSYKYDDFYRLQADERFADTIVRWLGSPAMVTNISNDAKFSGKIRFKAQRLSSQVIAVSYVTKDIKSAQNLAPSIIKVINDEANTLNEAQKEETWFKVIGDNPIVNENKFKLEHILLASLVLGIFLGIWGVMIKHYLE